MTQRNPEIQDREIHISSLEDLKRELSIDSDIQLDVKESFIATRSELDKLIAEMKDIFDEAVKQERVQAFINEKIKITTKTREGLEGVMGDGTIGGVFSQATRELREGFDEAQSKEGVGKLDSFFGMFSKLGGVWDKVALGFSGLAWRYMPSLAKMLGLENPADKIRQEATTQAEQARLEAQKEAERVKARQEHENNESRENSRGYGLYTSIYRRLFRSSHMVGNKIRGLNMNNRENRNLEFDLSGMIFEDNDFRNIKYNDLKNPQKRNDFINDIYNRRKNEPGIRGVDERKVKTIMEFVLLNIVGGSMTYNSKVFFINNQVTIDFDRGSTILSKYYKDNGLDISEADPTMEELFSNLKFLDNFSSFGNGNLNLDTILESMNGRLATIMSGGAESINSISQSNFNEIKGNLSNRLQNINDFQTISRDISGISSSLTLANNFSNDYIRLNISQTTKEFIEKDLLSFGSEFFKTLKNDPNFSTMLEGVTEETLTARQMYGFYLATGGKSSGEYSTTERMQITSQLITFGDAESIGEDAGKLLDSIGKKAGNASIDIPDDLQKMYEAIGDNLKTYAVDTFNYLLRLTKGFAKEKPLLVIGILAAVLMLPIFPKRTAILGPLRK